jgi:hypothetical protein
VFILGIAPSAAPNSVQALELLGTTFAITTTALLTACHVLRDEDGVDLVGDLVISRRVVKKGGVLSMVDPINVKILDFNEAADFAILKLNDPKVLSFSAFVPVCAEIDLPDPTVTENEDLKSYYAPIGQFLANGIVEMAIWSGSYQRVLQYDRNGETVLVECGLYRGSCGAPYINSAGCAVAMHLSSIHEGKSVTLVKKRKRVTGGSGSAVPSTLGDVIDSVSDLSEVHESAREGLVLCRQPRIMQEAAHP